MRSHVASKPVSFILEAVITTTDPKNAGHAVHGLFTAAAMRYTSAEAATIDACS